METSGLIVWIGAGALLWLVGGFAAAARSSRASLWFLVGTLGLGLCCCFLGTLGLESPPLGLPFWIRLLWSTLVLSIPPCIAFSYMFGRGGRQGQSFAQRPVMVAAWLGAFVLLAFGFARPPIGYGADRRLFELQPPMGRWVVVYALIGLIIALWNLHATLEAARGARKRRTASAVYALVPLVVTGIYLLADLLLYSQQGRGKTFLLVPAVFVSMVSFGVVLGRRRSAEISNPIGRPIVYSSIVLTALGFLFVTMAVVAQLFRLARVGPGRWYEPAIAGALILIFALTIFPGIRQELRGFLDRNLYVSRFEYRTVWQRLNVALAGSASTEELAASLHRFLRSLFGPIRMQLWILETNPTIFAAVGDDKVPNLGTDEPIVRALRQRADPLLIAGDASRIDEIPLHLACEEMAQRFGLRAFFPIHLSGNLVGILACGSGGTRVLHPEDIDLIGTVTDHLAAILGARSWRTADREQRPGLDGPSATEGTDA
jgi:hypothetical protein